MYANWQEDASVQQLQQQEMLARKNQEKVEAYRQQMLTTTQQLAALDALRGENNISTLLHALDAAYNPQIWLDQIHFLRRNDGVTGTLNNLPGATHANLIVVPEGAEHSAPNEQRVEITGHAINHSALAELMSRLGQQPGIANLQLMDTGLRSYTTVQVVDFKLSLRIEPVTKGNPS